MIMSLAQPSTELLNLFDNLCILSFGECLYFGSVLQAENYLLSLGFVRPQHKTIPAWIEEITTKPSKYLDSKILQSVFKIPDISMIPSHQSIIVEKKITRYFAKLFRNSQFFADVSKVKSKKFFFELFFCV